jgi:hypothetical protein
MSLTNQGMKPMNTNMMKNMKASCAGMAAATAGKSRTFENKRSKEARQENAKKSWKSDY